MALSDDQKAMLRLLARDQSYEDIAALMGLSVDEVVSRAQGSVAQLESEGIPAPALPDAPAAAAPPPPEPKPEKTPEPKEEPAEETSTQDLPTPGPKISAKPPAPAKGGSPRTGARLKLPEDRGARWGLAAGAGISLILILLLVTGVLGGDEGNDSDSKSGDIAASEQPVGSAKQPTQAILKAVDGGDAEGAGLFGRSGKKVVLVVQAVGLEPSTQNQSYAVSLSLSPTERAPIAAVKVGRSGQINQQFEVSPDTLGLLAGGFDEMEISLVSNAALRAALEESKSDGSVPVYTGTDVLRGEVTGPFVNIAAEEEGEG